MTDSRGDSYDLILYGSAPVPETHPGRMAVQASLFGLRSPDPATARVLELGCAEGGNLIPLAFYQPGGQYLGIERSAAQSARGQALIEAAGVTNARILCADLMEFDGGPGEFDYVIVHGLYSWAPAPVRARILEICSRVLSPSGVACISINTQPGWRMRAMLRDLALFHARDLTEPRARLDCMLSLLASLPGQLAGVQGPHADFLRAELAGLEGRDAGYIYHEYLEEVNDPILFADFMRDAQRHGLQYLCDTDLQSMFGDDLPAPAQAWLETIDDIVAREQYMDFLRGRAFRANLLCRKDHDLVGEIDAGVFEGFAFFGLLTPHQAPALRRVVEQRWNAASGRTIHVSQPLTKAALVILAAAYPDSVAAPELLSRAREAVVAAGGQARDEHCLAELTSLYIRQAVGVEFKARSFRARVVEYPLATALGRAQAAADWEHIATPRHAGLHTDAFARALLQSLDGRTPVESVTARLASRFDIAPAQARENTRRLLALFARQGVVSMPPGAA